MLVCSISSMSDLDLSSCLSETVSDLSDTIYSNSSSSKSSSSSTVSNKKHKKHNNN